VDEPLKHLMQELGNAINDSLSESDRIAEAIGEIKGAGYDVFLVLEATIGFNRRDESAEDEDGEPEMSDAEEPKRTFEATGKIKLTTQDHRFLRALKIAVDFANEGIISPAMAIERLSGIDLSSIVDQKVVSNSEPVAKGMPASIGIVTGEIALTNERAIERTRVGPIILVKEALTPDDISGIAASAGIITAHGNRMAHATVVARQLGKGCVVNVNDLEIDMIQHSVRMGGKVFLEGDVVSLDSLSGLIYEGAVQVDQERPTELIEWVERQRANIRT